MSARIGVFGIGLAAYWPQFPGMKSRLEQYQRTLETRVGRFAGDVVSAGMVDTPESARAAAQLGYKDQSWPVQYLSGKQQLERTLERQRQMEMLGTSSI